MNRDIKSIKCTEDEYEKCLVCITMIFIAAIANFDYIIVCKLSNIKTVHILFFIINFGAINFSKKFLLKYMFANNILKKRYLRGVLYLNVINIVDVSLYTMDINMLARNTGIFVGTIVVFIYAVVYILAPVVDISDGMELYLKER